MMDNNSFKIAIFMGITARPDFNKKGCNTQSTLMKDVISKSDNYSLFLRKYSVHSTRNLNNFSEKHPRRFYLTRTLAELAR